MRIDGIRALAYLWKATVHYTKANPVSGTKYTALETTINARIYDVLAEVTWTVQPDTLEVWLDIDGETIRGTQANPVSGTVYRFERNYAMGTSYVLRPLTANYTDQSFFIEGQSVKVQCEVTGGTTNPMECLVNYGVRV